LALGFPWLTDYDADRPRIAAEIASEFSDLKILLKTQNEPLMLREWIEHHSRIVGASGILIFDHGSTDPQVEEIYSTLSAQIRICRYQNFHNIIHHRRYHPELYDALQKSCKYYIFLDTDEYLIHTDGNAFISDHKIADAICHDPDIPFYPGVWLQNVMGYKDRFQLSVNMHTLIGGLKWGKPILASHLNAAEIQMQNMQVFESYAGKNLITNFMVLHRSMLSPNQRIQANLRKLVAYKVIKSIDDLHSILSMHSDSHEIATCRRFIREIQDLSSLPVDALGPRENSIELKDDGSILFQDIDQKQMFESFLRCPDRKWVDWE
jgi:hypothetical protein